MGVKVNIERWANLYFVLEIIWFVFWTAMVIAYQAGLGEEGEFYRTHIILNAFHLALLPSVAYTMRDAHWHIIIGYLAVVVTDTHAVWTLAAHTPAAAKDISWAYGTSLAVASLGLFITTFVALTWYIYVRANNYQFRVKTLYNKMQGK